MSDTSQSTELLTHRAALMAILAAILIQSGCSLLANSVKFRYRLTVEIEADGKVHTGSSVIEATYLNNASPAEAKGWASRLRGVAAVVDLGAYGTVIAALGGDLNEQFRKKRELKLKCEHAVDAITLPMAAYRLGPKEIGTAKGAKELKDGQFPFFIWLPDSSKWEGWDQLCPEEFPTTIGGGARLVRAVIEPEPNAVVAVKIEPVPSWLASLRYERKHGERYGPRNFSDRSNSFIERNF